MTTSTQSTEKHQVTVLSRLIAKIIEPHVAIQVEGKRRRARVFAAILAVCIPLFFISAILQVKWNPDIFAYLIPATICLLSAYGLSRTQHFEIGATLTLIIFSALPMIGILTQPEYNPDHVFRILMWMVPTLIIGSLLRQPRGLLLLYVANLIALYALTQWTTLITPSDLLTNTAFTASITLLLLIAARGHETNLQQLDIDKQQLSTSNTFLNTIINSLSSPFYVINVNDYSIALANHAAAATGSSPAQTCYARSHQRETPCDELEHPCPLRRVTETKKPCMFEHTHYDSSGNPSYVEVYGYPIFDEYGQVTQMIEYVIDITDRKQVEDELRKLQKATNQSASGIVITNAQAVIEYVNPAFTAITGYTEQEATGKNTNLLNSGQHSVEFFQELWQTIRNGKAWRGEIYNKKKNGELYWELQTISPIQDSAGETTHYVAIKEDITQRKQMEVDLAEARDQALAASRFKGQILANASHDMRTPLGAILGYTEMMEEGFFGPITDEQRKRLGNILNSTNQLKNIVDNLLHQSEIESGELSFHLQVFTPDQLLEDTRATMTSLAERKGLELTFEIAPQVPPILWGDVYWLQRIITNLANNAVKFTKEGQVHVAITRPDNDHWVIQVNDTGRGIHPEAQKKIFKAFQKGDLRPDDTHLMGSGLGLAIVKAVSERMNGFVSLESTLGVGSTFSVTLPLLLIPENQDEV